MPALPQSPHGDLLCRLMPPVSYDVAGEHLAASLTADGLTLDRVASAADTVLLGLDPFKDLGWMAAYEAEYALPDTCFSGNLSYDERVTQLAVALREEGGISRRFYLWLAAVFGYAFRVQEFRPFQAGSKAGEPLTNGGWHYTWVIRTDGLYTRRFRASRSCAGEALRTWGDASFECLFRKYAPAHTIVHFAYE